MNTANTTATATISTLIPTLTLREAVVESVNEILKTTQSFSFYDITKLVRDKVNSGEIAIPGNEAIQPNPSNIKYWVNHEDVKSVIDTLLNDGTLNNMGLKNVCVNGTFRVFEFDSPVTPQSTDNNIVVITPSSSSDDDATNSPLEVRIKSYLSNVGTATLKQVQSAMKVNGVTCKDFADIVKNLGFTLTPGTPDKFSTYIVS